LKFLIVALGCVACGPLGPREVTGGVPEPPPTLPGKIVVSEAYPPGAHLVFVDEGGRRTADLTPPPAGATLDLTPAWSPDGRFVAFASSRGRGSLAETSLWIVPADRSAPPRQVTDDSGVDLSPAFSPDGTRLVFASTRGTGHLELWRLDLGTKALTQLTHDGEAYAPAWSHRGELIAYTRVTGDGGRELAVIPVAGGAPRVLGTGAEPAFSPDDTTLVFVAPAGESGLRSLWRIGVDGGGRALLAEDPLGDCGEPAYAGPRLVIASSAVRSDDGHALFGTVVAVDLDETPPRFRALVDALPVARRGAAVAPAGLDAAAVRRDPDYREAMRRLLLK
jgi:dipeptidyl aminopeptidase/acylaminoacyl peptidase